MKSGKVYLVGAGPGDPGLITVKGLNCLRQADVVIYDRLVDESILGEVRSDAEKIYVGKSSDHHTLEQTEINRLLIGKARDGKKVVRLKGGTPSSSDEVGRRQGPWSAMRSLLKWCLEFHLPSPFRPMPGSR